MRKYSILITAIVTLMACAPFERQKSKNSSEPERNEPENPDTTDDKLKPPPRVSIPDTKTPDKNPNLPVSGTSPTKGTPNVGACSGIVQEFQQIPESESSALKPVEMAQAFLEFHNDIRRRYDLKAFTWDNDIANYAQAWANYLRDNNNCEMIHRSVAKKTDGKQYGENLMLNRSTGQLAAGNNLGSPKMTVFAWSDECKDYSYEKNTCTVNEQCGHFTQVVWRDSQRVGCGVATCRSGAGQKDIWVCNYDPPGNYIDPKAPSGELKTFRPY